MSAATRGTGQGYWLNLPDGWLPLDLTGERVPVQVQRLLELRIEQEPTLAAHRGAIERQIVGALREVRRRKPLFAALLATFTSTGLPVTASLVLTKHASPLGSQATQILGGLDTGVGKTNTLLDLPFVGAVVRSEFRDRTPITDVPHKGDSGVAENAVYQYFVPVPGGREVLLMTGTTPTLPLARQFGELFDGIMATFQFIDESDRGAAHG